MNYMYGINYNAPSGLWFTRLCSGTGLNPVLQYHALSGQKVPKSHYPVTMGIAHQILYEIEELKKSVLQRAFTVELLSPEGALSDNDGHSPSIKKVTLKSLERAK